MSDGPDPPRIWLEPCPYWYGDRQWCPDDVWTGDPEYLGKLPTEYIRADIAEIKIAKLRKALEEIAETTISQVSARIAQEALGDE